MNSTQVVILAAGRSSRFLKKNSKLLEKLKGRTIVNRVVAATFEAKIKSDNIKISSCVLVVGYQSEEIKKCLDKDFSSFCTFVEQKEQLGTGDALFQAQTVFEKNNDLLVINGDLPLITSTYLEEFLFAAKLKNMDLYVASCVVNNPLGYGRIISKDGIFKIIEEKDLVGQEKENCVVNGGVYFFSAEAKKELINFYKEKVPSITKKEIYITDFVNYIAENKNYACGAYNSGKNSFLVGVNTQEQFFEAECILENGY